VLSTGQVGIPRRAGQQSAVSIAVLKSYFKGWICRLMRRTVRGILEDKRRARVRSVPIVGTVTSLPYSPSLTNKS